MKKLLVFSAVPLFLLAGCSGSSDSDRVETILLCHEWKIGQSFLSTTILSQIPGSIMSGANPEDSALVKATKDGMEKQMQSTFGKSYAEAEKICNDFYGQ